MDQKANQKRERKLITIIIFQINSNNGNDWTAFNFTFVDKKKRMRNQTRSGGGKQSKWR